MDVCEYTAVSALMLCMAFFKASLRKCCRAMLSLVKLRRQSRIYVTMGRAVAACAATARGVGQTFVFPLIHLSAYVLGQPSCAWAYGRDTLGGG